MADQRKRSFRALPSLLGSAARLVWKASPRQSTITLGLLTFASLSLFGQIVELSELEAEVPDARSPVLSYELAARVEFERAAKQELLESRSERDRLAVVTKLLELTAVQLAREKEASDRAPTNGKVSPR